ncbi:hypothetical protein IH979_01935 [Patescibacteria group bacterium]|nr:hypothetical protein [Patescibacteria group bacterium]
MISTNILRKATIGLVATGMMVGSLFAALPVQAEEQSESFVEVHFSGQLIELSSTEKPTTIVVRENPQGEFTDHTVDVTEDTFTVPAMDGWLVGDYVTVRGQQNENTDVVIAKSVVNQSVNLLRHGSLNGWIEEVAEDGSYIVVQWQDILHTVNITDNTHLVGNDGPNGTIDDFELGDRVRIRLIKDSEVENEARIIMILRRGPRIYNLARTRGFWAELNEIDGENDTMNVTILENPHLRDGDVNNLVGVEGEQVTVTWNEYTKFVRRYFGSTTEDELSPGDRLFIVGRVNDDGTVLSRLIKDNSIFISDLDHHVGEIVDLDTDANTVTVVPVRNSEGEEWTINYDDETVFLVNGERATEDDLAVGMVMRARGTANFQLKTVDAVKIAAYDKDLVFELHEARISEMLNEVEEYEQAL